MIGSLLIGTSFAGKAFIRFYRAAKLKNAFGSGGVAGQVGRYYKGGFEGTMTSREAAMILGVRESADTKAILDRHRKMMFLNHPDQGGSTYLTMKINEAKEKLCSSASDAR